jgi:hypothetical protein
MAMFFDLTVNNGYSAVLPNQLATIVNQTSGWQITAGKGHRGVVWRIIIFNSDQAIRTNCTVVTKRGDIKCL